MFGFLKPLLRRLVESPVDTAPPPEPDFYSETQPEESPTARLRAARSSRDLHPNSRPQAGRPNGKGVELPLQPIIHSLPLELQPRVLYPEVGDATISVPLEKILAQLSRGVVKI